MSDSIPPPPDPYRAVILTLFAAAILGSLGALLFVDFVSVPALADLAVAFGLAAGCLLGVEQNRRLPSPRPDRDPVTDPAEPAPQTRRDLVSLIRRRFELRRIEGGEALAVWVGAGGLVGIVLTIVGAQYTPLSLREALLGIAVCASGAVLTATVVHYLETIDVSALPESVALARGGRVLAWMLVAAAMSAGLLGLEQTTAVRAIHSAEVLVNLAICYGLVSAKPPRDESRRLFPLDLGVLTVLGSRPNIAGSILDTAEEQLGIDVRSTWALAVVRRSLEPLVIALCAVAWLSTSLTIVAVDEQAVVERLGVPLAGTPLQPGIHLHWPWPVDRAFRIPAFRVQTLAVGHEGEERGGPEDVLWARQHAENEYTLLLGNGRDLITVDAAVQYRISDPRAWRYHSRNPADALKAIAYRAVMRTTVNRTLTDALSENVVRTTARMRSMVQQDADALGLGVEVLDFTIGGMHPPVSVASAYQAVVSSELGKTTAIVDAQAFRNRTVPGAESSALVSMNKALSDTATAASRSAGEASSFLMLQSQYRASPEDYMFRRRLEMLEKALADRRFTIVDARFQRDGGELWVTP